jgi:rhodanese-related sulfurtransferase/DNA-directed RNA polymerase subunit RPC12/RpoP
MKNLLVAVVLLIQFFSIESCSNAASTKKEIAKPDTDTSYVCVPCGRSCDTVTYNKPGSCSSCMMNLVDKKTATIKNIVPEAVCNFITDRGNNNVLLLDVRTPEEFNGTAPDKFGKLSGAINIPVQELEARVKELLPYKEKEIVVYCSHSHRSPQASYMLTQNGFKNVTNMTGGMSVWRESVKQNDCNNKLFVKQ